MTVIEFLEARITEDEVSATYRECHREGCETIPNESGYSFPCDCGLPERMTAECAAKRAILEYYALLSEQSKQMELFGYHATGLRIAIKHLAMVYSNHHDYLEEWAL